MTHAGRHRAADAGAIKDALAGLSPWHRRIIIEMYYLHRPVTTTAARLGVPPGDVQARALDALRELRLALQARGLIP